MKWRLIEQNKYSAAMNMAIDHSIYESVANERVFPTIRFYKWLNSSLSIGAYQNQNDINLEACQKLGISIVRRMTGGSAVLHDKADFTYSVIAPIRVFDYSIEVAYKHICSCIINTLKKLGINATLENKNDIVVNKKKISGNAAKAMNKGVYLQHGTLTYDFDPELVSAIVNIPKDLTKEKIASVLQYQNVSQNSVYEALKESFTANKDYRTEELSRSELMRSEELAKTRYNSIIPQSGFFVKNKGYCYTIN